MPGEVMAGSALGSGLGTVIGGLLSPQRDPYADIDIPALQELINAGKIDATAFTDINLDPATRDAQIRAMTELANEGNRGGASLQSRAAQANLMDTAATAERMNREAILRDMASRGQAGGGAELAARLVANQNTNRNTALSSAQLAGDDRARALQAMTSAGSLGGNIRGQDYGIAANRAQAQDALARWNAQNRTGAYDRRLGWQFQKAGGEAGIQDRNYNRNVKMGGAMGGLAGGAYDYAASANRIGGGGSAKPTGWDSSFDDPSDYG